MNVFKPKYKWVICMYCNTIYNGATRGHCPYCETYTKCITNDIVESRLQVVDASTKRA